MIRSSCHSLKDTNASKLVELSRLVDDYRQMVSKYVNLLWDRKKPGSLIPSKTCNLIATSRDRDSILRQCAAKQAWAMVRGTRAKHRKRTYKLAQLQRAGADTRSLQRTIDLHPLVKPNCRNVNLELDSRFVNFQESKGQFDLFIEIKNIGNKIKLRLPLQQTKVSRKWLSQGTLKATVRLTKNQLFLFYEMADVPRRETGRKVGADQGILSCLTLSDGQVTIKDPHGHDLSSILDRLARRRKGSKGFQRAVDQRKNYINWSVKQLNLDGVKTLALEKVKNIRRGRSSSRKHTHWTYTLIKGALVRRSQVEGFSLVEQASQYRSQRCSRCGWVHRSNRKGKVFKCKLCQFTTDADLNAALNHEAELPELAWDAWRDQRFKSGFFWTYDGIVNPGQELIVPDTQTSIGVA